ncbi:hypothetical protein [Microbispora sp. H11081]|uniref:hypothetical protein n=1 Tax=Microbispora sp. H11081 TaxID=2729107 RepID=UPI00147501D1|nr:hypothetical protein [Microbispora sp. H11081]
MRTNRQYERGEVAGQPTPETSEPLEEEARRERVLTDTGRDEHEGPGPVYSPGGETGDTDTAGDASSAGYTDAPGRTDATRRDADSHADADGDHRFREPYDETGDHVLTSPRTGDRHTADGDRLVAGGRAADDTESGQPYGAETGAYGSRADESDFDTDPDTNPDTNPGTDLDTNRDADTRRDTYSGAGTPATADRPSLDGPVAYPATTTTAASGAASVLDEALEGRWREIKAGFVDDPRHSVEQADALVDEALSAFTTRRQALLDQWKDNERGDTEALRQALHEYHALLAQLTRK